jgi:co-chaperonin GroES (HSP10)
MYPVCPLNYILVQIGKKYQDTITTKSGIQFYKETRFNPGWHTTITGKVVSTPQAISGDLYHGGLKIDVKPDDEILFSYRVVYDESYNSANDHVFFEEEHPIPEETVWANKLGLIIMRRYLMNDKWSCVCFNQQGEKLDVMTGGERELDMWMSKYSFHKHTDISFKNLLVIDGKEYWKVDVANIIAVKTKDGYTMTGGNVLLEPHKKGGIEHQGRIILLSDSHRKGKNQATATIKSIGKARKKPISAKAGDEVYYDKRFAEQYDIDGDEFIILKQERILAKVV